MPGKMGIDRLELLVNADLEIAKLKSKLKKAQGELATIKSELRTLNAIDPERLKKNLADIKKKMASSHSVIKNQTAELVQGRRTLKKVGEELYLSQSDQDQFYTSVCGNWSLHFTGFKYPNEQTDKGHARIKCLNRTTGTSMMASSIQDKQITWSDEVDLPIDVIAVVLERVKILGLYN
jgi:hypothetical protein